MQMLVREVPRYAISQKSALNCSRDGINAYVQYTFSYVSTIQFCIFGLLLPQTFYVYVGFIRYTYAKHESDFLRCRITA